MDKQEPRVLQTSIIASGATSVRNVNINNCTVIGQQQNIIHSADSSPEQKKNIWFKMREPIASYTGRHDKLNEVHNLFFPTNDKIKPNHLVAIVGLGGIGKSEFARKFAKSYYIHSKYYSQLDRNVIWVNAESAQLLIDSFKELANHIGIKHPELSGKAEILQMIDQVYGYFGEKKSLFIFDNVGSWVLEDYLPNRMAPDVKKPFVLMTSRIRPSGIRVIELSVLEVAEAVELIKARLEVKKVDGQCFDLLSKLADLLGCLPLALQQASSYVKQEMESDISGKQQNEKFAWCIKTYIKMFEVETKNLLDYKPEYIQMDVDFEELKTTLLTWRITLEKIKDLNPSAIQLLAMMSYISPDGIHLEMFKAQFTVDDLKVAVDRLVRFSMITKNSESSNIVSVHRLVQAVVRLDNGKESTLKKEKASRENEDNKPLESVLNILNTTLNDLPDNITHYTTSCVKHSQVAWEYALAHPELLKHFKAFPISLYNKAKLHEMHTTNLSLLQRALSKYKEYSIYKESDEHYIWIQHLIACELRELHKYEDAKSLWNTIHKTAADELGESDRLTLAILNGLTVAEGRLGNFSQQMTNFEKIIAIRTATCNIGPCHKDTLSFLHNKAVCLVNIKKYDEALELFKSTLESKEKHHPEDRKSINETRDWMAHMTLRQGNVLEALQMFTNLHAELVASFRESHTDTLHCALGIGECLLSLGRYEEAMEILKHNLELANENPSARLQRVYMQYSMAKVLLKMEMYDEAISKFRIILDDEWSIYGEAHPVVLATREQLADALQCAGCTVEALEHYKFVYENRVNILGVDHPETIRAKESIAKIKK